METRFYLYRQHKVSQMSALCQAWLFNAFIKFSEQKAGKVQHTSHFRYLLHCETEFYVIKETI